MNAKRVVVIGAGIAGLVAAARLAHHGFGVTVLERAAAPGGKLREMRVGEHLVDCGPTVFTMRWVFEDLMASLGERLADHVTLRQADLLARHAWSDGARLDLFADKQRSAEAIARFAGPQDARGYLAFCAQSERVYRMLERPFIRASRPSAPQLVQRIGFNGFIDLLSAQPFTSMWSELGKYFRNARLRQLFGRYATYCGSSPYQAPGTLMLVAHVEQEGVWLIEGGMARLVDALAGIAAARGARFRYNADVAEIGVRSGTVTGVRLADGEWIEADHVVFNGDAAALGDGLFGRDAQSAVARNAGSERSQSAITWAAVAETAGFPLARHNVFFSDDYAAEFDDVFKRRRPPRNPTVYVCAQDRDDGGGRVGHGPERLLCLINAPATGDHHAFDAEEIATCQERTFRHLQRSGLEVTLRPDLTEVTTPADFNRRFPATGGGLYGQASHGWTATFQRSGSRTRQRGLYLAGGSVHPGPGVPMAALSGSLAVEALIQDLASNSGSTRRSRLVAMPGGTSMA